MTRRDRKRLAPDSAPPAKAKTAKERDAGKLPAAAPPADETPPEGSYELAPFMTEEHERFGNADMQTAAGPSAGVEQVGASPPEQIDPGAGGKVVI